MHRQSTPAGVLLAKQGQAAHDKGMQHAEQPPPARLAAAKEQVHHTEHKLQIKDIPHI